jgi:23S rRNA pseudouridine2605 synthase
VPAAGGKSPLSTNREERLQRVLAAAGVASRRKAESMIAAGRVTVDGRTVTELGTKVDPDRAVIRVDGKRIRREPPRYIVLNKPSGYITTTSDERGRRTVMEFLPREPRLYPVGRLDRDTEGLLLFTNDGDLANRVMHPRFGLVKEYQILTSQKPPEAIMQRVRSGLLIDGRTVVPDEFRIVRELPEGALLTMVIHEGMNHVVRKMMDAAGIPVRRLRRVRIGPLSLAGIPKGAARDLTAGEVISLREALHIDPDASALQGSTPGRPSRSAPSNRQSSARSRSPRPKHDAPS